MADSASATTVATADQKPSVAPTAAPAAPAVAPAAPAAAPMAEPPAEQKPQPQQQQVPQPAVPIMAPQHIFHFQGISAAEAMRRSGGHLAMPRPEAFGFVPQRCALSSYSNSKKNRNNNKAPWTKEEDEEVPSPPQRGQCSIAI